MKNTERSGLRTSQVKLYSNVISECKSHSWKESWKNFFGVESTFSSHQKVINTLFGWRFLSEIGYTKEPPLASPVYLFGNPVILLFCVIYCKSHRVYVFNDVFGYQWARLKYKSSWEDKFATQRASKDCKRATEPGECRIFTSLLGPIVYIDIYWFVSLCFVNFRGVR